MEEEEEEEEDYHADLKVHSIIYSHSEARPGGNTHQAHTHNSPRLCRHARSSTCKSLHPKACQQCKLTGIGPSLSGLDFYLVCACNPRAVEQTKSRQKMMFICSDEPKFVTSGSRCDRRLLTLPSLSESDPFVSCSYVVVWCSDVLSLTVILCHLLHDHHHLYGSCARARCQWYLWLLVLERALATKKHLSWSDSDRN